jgi:hypothetical protein
MDWAVDISRNVLMNGEGWTEKYGWSDGEGRIKGTMD